MLKITVTTEGDLTLFGLEGKLIGPWVSELESQWIGVDGPRRKTEVDLTSVSFIDAAGQDLLRRMVREGASLIATDCMNRCIVDKIVESQKGR